MIYLSGTQVQPSGHGLLLQAWSGITTRNIQVVQKLALLLAEVVHKVHTDVCIEVILSRVLTITLPIDYRLSKIVS